MPASREVQPGPMFFEPPVTSVVGLRQPPAPRHRDPVDRVLLATVRTPIPCPPASAPRASSHQVVASRHATAQTLVDDVVVNLPAAANGRVEGEGHHRRDWT